MANFLERLVSGDKRTLASGKKGRTSHGIG